MNWANLLKIWTWALESDPYSRKEKEKTLQGAGVSDIQSMPDLRSEQGYMGGGRTSVVLRSGDLIDIAAVANRPSRYKEYERLRIIPEIETALTIFADESCVAGDTKVATPFGFFSIADLARDKKPDEEFLVYAYDFSKNNFTLAWAYHPRIVKKAKMLKFILEDGTFFSCTPDHRVLLRTGEWIEAGDIRTNYELMPFYRVRPEKVPNKQDAFEVKGRQFARVYNLKNGWRTERRMLDEWRGGKPLEERVSKIFRLVEAGLGKKDLCKIMGLCWESIRYHMKKEGITYINLKRTKRKYPDRRKVIHICNIEAEDVYDLSVREHENFATDTTVFHNCQIGDNGHVFNIEVKNEDIKKELEFLMFKILKMDRKLWNIAKNLYLRGDHFMELILDDEDPKLGILKTKNLPAEQMWRIETNKGKVIEFQQGKSEDYACLTRYDIKSATEQELAQSVNIRFTPEQIVHFKIGDDRYHFYPYGVSIVESARGAANNLRLLEDAMLCYRLSRGTEKRVFYIDVTGLPPFRAEHLMQRMQDTFRKKKTYNAKGGTGASAVEERWNSSSVDEDIWIPTKQNSNTRVETLPGAANIDNIDDAKYFRDKLFIALHLPKSYMNQEDAAVTKVSLSTIDVKFSRLIQRMQSCITDGLMDIAIRHLELRGFPCDLYDDLKISLTPPSYAKEVSENEVMQIRYDRAMALKGSGMMADFDILVRILKLSPEESKEIVARATIQKIQDLKLQIMAQNPELTGMATTGHQGQEMGTEQGGPNPQLTGDEQTPGKEISDEGQEEENVEDTYGKPKHKEGSVLPDASPEDIKKYDLELMDFSKDLDEEEM